jgi:hypothetical protein
MLSAWVKSALEITMKHTVCKNENELKQRFLLP